LEAEPEQNKYFYVEPELQPHKNDAAPQHWWNSRLLWIAENTFSFFPNVTPTFYPSEIDF
jgi:hypothetical protein